MPKDSSNFQTKIKTIRDCLDAVEILFAELERVYGLEAAAKKAEADPEAKCEEKKGVCESFEKWREERARKFGGKPPSA